MNLTISRTSNNTFKQLKVKYIAAACGIALAVAAVTSVGVSQSSHLTAGKAGPGLASSATRGPIVSHYTYYVVGSLAEQDALIEKAMGDDFLAGHSWIVVVESLEEEIRMAQTQAELTDLGHIAEVVDLRGR